MRAKLLRSLIPTASGNARILSEAGKIYEIVIEENGATWIQVNDSKVAPRAYPFIVGEIVKCGYLQFQIIPD